MSANGQDGQPLLHVVAADALAQTVAALIADRLRDAVQQRGVATLAVSGGGTPLGAFDELARLEVPWRQVHVLQVDERVAPAGDPARNAEGLRARLLDAVPVPAANVHLVPVAADPDEAAATYATMLAAVAGTPAVLDLVQLGLGDDGHTASLFPGDPVLEVVDRDVAATAFAHHGLRRITLTYPALNRARARVWMVAGAGKAGAVARLWERDDAVPAARVATERSHLVIDEAAAAELRHGRTS